MTYRNLKVNASNILPEVIIFEPEIYWDERGNIFTSFHEDIYKEFLYTGIKFKHDKFAYNKKNVLRGLHGDNKTWKLVSCVYGRIYEVVVDMREKSPNYLRWEAFELSGEKYRQILIPPGFVNGYYVLSEEAVFHYKLSYEGEYVDAESQITVKWNDPRININWPCEDPILQLRDK